MKTAEEFFREKLKAIYPEKAYITLSQINITAEQGMRWAHEFASQFKTVGPYRLEQPVEDGIAGTEYSSVDPENGERCNCKSPNDTGVVCSKCPLPY